MILLKGHLLRGRRILHERLFYMKSDDFEGGLAQWLASQTKDQGVPGSRPCQVAVHCGFEQVTFYPC